MHTQVHITYIILHPNEKGVIKEKQNRNIKTDRNVKILKLRKSS